MPGPAARAARVALTVALAAAASAPAPAVAERRGLVPDHAKVQVAGRLGVVAPGVGYALAGGRVESDVLIGWVPASMAGVDLVMLTGKVSWFPWRVGLGGAWTLRPVSAAAAVTWTIGDGFWVLPPDRYPRGYYELPSGLRGTLALGSAVARSTRRDREVGVYGEVVAGDVPLAYWITNGRAVRASDVLSLAFGVRVEF